MKKQPFLWKNNKISFVKVHLLYTFCVVMSILCINKELFFRILMFIIN